MSRYFDAAKRILTVVTDGMVAADRTLPDRIAVQPGADPQWDCEQLTIAVVRPSIPGSAGAQDPRARPVSPARYCEFRLELVRCLPEGDNTGLVAVADWETAADELLTDAEVWETVLVPNALSGPEGSRRGVPVQIGPIVLLGPLGGLASISITLGVPL